MVKLSDLTTAEEIHERDMADPVYRAEHERTRFANDIAIRVLTYRNDHGLTQTAFGRLVGDRSHVEVEARARPSGSSRQRIPAPREGAARRAPGGCIARRPQSRRRFQCR